MAAVLTTWERLAALTVAGLLVVLGRKLGIVELSGFGVALGAWAVPFLPDLRRLARHEERRRAALTAAEDAPPEIRRRVRESLGAAAPAPRRPSE